MKKDYQLATEDHYLRQSPFGFSSSSLILSLSSLSLVDIFFDVTPGVIFFQILPAQSSILYMNGFGTISIFLSYLTVIFPTWPLARC